MDAADRRALASLVATARRALPVGEDDDALFFRAQRLVRRPLRALGRALAEAGALDAAEDVFDLPLDEARRLARSSNPPVGEHDLARVGRARREQARRLAPPAVIRDGVAGWRGRGGGVLTGAATAGRARGRAVLLDDPAAAPAQLPPGAVLVARAILPSLTWLLPSAAALVTDHGGALSHGATLAREYGVPAVLGTGVATSRLRDGDELLVDGDAGRVFVLTAR
jgi:pyruvate,water dikinase